MRITLRTLTPLWTGGVDRTTDRLHETGLIGSLRWWYEVLVRGLGGYACDPTSDDCCPDQDGRHCIACELFGCTGWGRKFRLQVIGQPEITGKGTRRAAVKEGQTFQVQFVPLRSIAEEEWCLLQLSLRLIAEYGAIGGKTVFKPSDEPSRQNQFHHRDFGLVDITFSPDWPSCTKGLDGLKAYVQAETWRKGNHRYRDEKGEHDYSWASLQNFWCVKGRYLARQDSHKSTFNRVITRKEPKHQAKQPPENTWLAGSQQQSKKVFSFKQPARTFGFIKPGQIEFDDIKKRLRQAWPDFGDDEFLIGAQILVALCATEGGNR